MEEQQSEMMEAKRELRENTEHGAMNLYSAGGFEALVELSQSMTPVTDLAANIPNHNILFLLNGLHNRLHFGRSVLGEHLPEDLVIDVHLSGKSCFGGSGGESCEKKHAVQDFGRVCGDPGSD